MHLDSLKKRTIRIVTTPAELLYALTRHWAVIACCLSIGVIVTAAKVATDAPIFRAQATLIVDPDSSVVMSRGRAPQMTTRDVARYLNEQISVLRSSAVLHAVADALTAKVVLDQDENPDAPIEPGLRKSLYDLRLNLSNWRDWLRSPNAEDDVVPGRELERMQRQAVRSFRSRSQVVAEPTSNTIKLLVYGSNKGTLENEVTEWYTQYRNRLEEMHEEVLDSFLDSQKQVYREIEGRAFERISEFRAGNPEVSRSNLEWIEEEVQRWREARNTLEDRLQFPGESSPVLPPPERLDAQAESLRQRIEAVKLQILEARARGVKQESRVMEKLTNTLELLETELAGVDTSPSEPADENATDPAESREAALSRQLSRANQRLSDLRSKQREIEEKLTELGQLEEEHQQARERRKAYESLDSDQTDAFKHEQLVKVRLGDPAEVSGTPINVYPHRQVLFGSLGGLGVGLILAIGLEILCGRVRFRNDVTQEYGVPVVGVVPKR